MSCFVNFLQFIGSLFQDLETKTKTSVPTKLSHNDDASSITCNVDANSAIKYENIQQPSNVWKFSEISPSPTVQTRETKPKASVQTKVPHNVNASSITRNVDANSATKYENIQKPFNLWKLSEISTSSPVQTQEGKTKTSVRSKLPHNVSASLITPNVTTKKSATQYENTIQKLSACTSEFSQPASSSSTKPPRPSSKFTLMPLAASSSANQLGKTDYVLVQKATSPTYAIPKDLENLFERDIVPMVLKKNVTPSTYKEYFETLLYAEDFYFEKWNGFKMTDVPLELHEAAIYKRGDNWNVNEERDDKVFAAFKMNSVPESRPFLLSRDFVSVHPSGKETASFEGVIYRVIKSNLVLVEFEKDFYRQYYPSCKYHVKFSFNRVCLKRALQAISVASESLFQNFLFPNSKPKTNTSPFPYIIEGPLSVTKSTWSSTSRHDVHGTTLSRTGKVIRDKVLKIYSTYPSCHILICAPTNKTCDVITRSLQKEIPDIFRANAAFREFDGVPLEIFPNCSYKSECFSCPPLNELRQLKVVVSTFMSAFRLHNEGVTAGHFSHIFLVDASSITEPEALVALANLADDETSVIVSGSSGNRSSWVRSNIARRYGLMVSFFERIRKCQLYQDLDPRFIMQLVDSGQ